MGPGEESGAEEVEAYEGGGCGVCDCVVEELSATAPNCSASPPLRTGRSSVGRPCQPRCGCRAHAGALCRTSRCPGSHAPRAWHDSPPIARRRHRRQRPHTLLSWQGGDQRTPLQSPLHHSSTATRPRPPRCKSRHLLSRSHHGSVYRRARRTASIRSRGQRRAPPPGALAGCPRCQRSSPPWRGCRRVHGRC